MSPAPVRAPRRSFPHAWGYWLGVLAMLAGVVVAVVVVASATRGFAQDVRDLRRVAGSDSLEVALEEGEHFVFDEDGAGIGPFGVRVFRSSDGLEVPTSAMADGPSYDVDGFRGRARAAFDIPRSDIYRVEIDTSVDDLARFAVGGDVGSDRTNRVIRGLVVGAVLFLAGFVAVIWTLAMHARWRLRTEVGDRVAGVRDALSTATAPVATPEDRAASSAEVTERASSWARERLERARDAVGTAPGDHGRRPALRNAGAARAQGALDEAQRRLDALEPAVSQAAADAGGSADMAARIDATLGRVQERIARGDRLRDIATDERVAAEQAAAELAQRARLAEADLAERRVKAAQAVAEAEARARAVQAGLVQQGDAIQEQLIERAAVELDLLDEQARSVAAESLDRFRTDARAILDQAAISAGVAMAGAAASAPPEPPAEAMETSTAGLSTVGLPPAVPPAAPVRGSGMAPPPSPRPLSVSARAAGARTGFSALAPPPPATREVPATGPDEASEAVAPRPGTGQPDFSIAPAPDYAAKALPR